MKIKVNNEPQILERSITVADLLVQNKVEMPDMVSVQLNGEFVQKENYKSTALKDNDEIDFLYFMGGGQEERFSTKAIHSKSLKKDPHGALHFPIYENVAFEFDTAEGIEKAFSGQNPAHMYSRITNPTVENFEQKIKNVTDAVGVVAVSSGMAAISNFILAVAQTGDNIITTKYLFGNTFSLFEKTLKPWGLETRYADLSDVKNVGSLIDKNTKAIFVETITNPQLQVADLEALGKLAAAKNILLVVDSTVTPLYFIKAKELGVNIELLSSTKYISGGATSVGGLIIDYGNYDWKNNPKLREDAIKYGPFTLITRLKREVFRNLGSCLSPHNAYLQSLGLETLDLRADKSCENTLALAQLLEKSPKVVSVNYPGLKSSKYNNIAKKQFGEKFGALLTFDLKDKKQCFKFMNSLKLVRRATNLNDNKTLILHPASTIFCEYSDALKKEMGVADSLIRLAVGIEDIEDLKADIAQALELI